MFAINTLALSFIFALLLPMGAHAMIKEVPKVTIELANGVQYTIAQDIANVSQTLNGMIEDTGSDQAIPLTHIMFGIPDALNFEYAIKNVLNDKDRQQKIDELQKYLQNLSEQELQEIIKTANYLDLPNVLDESVQVLAKQLMQFERIKQCLREGSYNLNLLHDMQLMVTSKYIGKVKDDYDRFFQVIRCDLLERLDMIYQYEKNIIRYELILRNLLPEQCALMLCLYSDMKQEQYPGIAMIIKNMPDKMKNFMERHVEKQKQLLLWQKIKAHTTIATAVAATAYGAYKVWQWYRK